MSVPIRDASTVLPLRDGPEGLEVFMVRRSLQLGFLGGAHVFPGGAVDPEDGSEPMQRYLRGFEAVDACRVLQVQEERRARGHYVAAFRELFEEAGVLLALSAGGLPCGAAEQATLAAERSQVAAGRRRFCDVLEELGLVLATENLAYFAHWITPAPSPKRFDTRFFLAFMPTGQNARHEVGETIDGEWVRPGAALARYARGEMAMVVPTICALDRLTLHGSAEEAMRSCRELDVVDVVPNVARVGERLVILYPGDPGYGTVGRFSEPGRMLSRRPS
jgi:8-oxo-dGTP pyrophosphatase MutT (NUDIX family)